MTETMTTTERREPAERRYRDLFGARSVIGAIAVVAVLCLFGFGIQAIDDAVKRSSGFEVGSLYTVSPTTSFTPAPGWVIDPTATTPGSVVTATKNGWTIKVIGVLTLQPGQSLEDFGKLFRDGENRDVYTHVDELTSFTTTGGQTGLTWSAHGTTNAAQQWDVAEGTSVGQLRAEGSAANLASVQEDLDAMAASLVVTAPAADGGGS